jgi:hypothetical protein
MPYAPTIDSNTSLGGGIRYLFWLIFAIQHRIIAKEEETRFTNGFETRFSGKVSSSDTG